MLNFGNKEFRNLQEQVLKNMQDIQGLEFGLNIRGAVANVPDLPDDAELGDAYLVGVSAPYYIYVKTGEPKEFRNVGTLASTIPGPKGDTGDKGEPGERGNRITTGGETPHIQGKDGDLYLKYDGTLYEYDKFWKPKMELRGRQGMQGNEGPIGPRGPEGPKGDKGEKGDRGVAIRIIGTVPAVTNLPSPTSVTRDSAYLVQADGNVYALVGDSVLRWSAIGKIVYPGFGTTKGVAYEGDKGNQNAIDIADLKTKIVTCPHPTFDDQLFEEINTDGDKYDGAIIQFYFDGGDLEPYFYGSCIGTYDMETEQLIIIGPSGQGVSSVAVWRDSGRRVSTYPVNKPILDRKANVDGLYELMTVGESLGLINPLGKTVIDDTFIDRPAADGRTVGSKGTAVVKEVGGNTVKFNQIVKPATDPITKKGVTMTIVPQGIKLDGTSDGADLFIITTTDTPQTINHKMFLNCFTNSVGSNDTFFCYLTSTSGPFDYGQGCIQTNTASGQGYVICKFRANQTFNNVILQPKVVDLTEMYGEGNEPVDINDGRINGLKRILQKQPKYNTGELISATPSTLTSYGKNMFNTALIFGNIFSQGNEDTNNTGIKTDFIKIDSKYITLQQFNFSDYTGRFICYYDENRQFIDRYANNSKTAPFPITLPDNARYIKLYFTNGGNPMTIPLNPKITLIKGLTPLTEYLPYVTDELITDYQHYFFDDVMRGVGNVRDTLDSKQAVIRLAEIDLGSDKYVKSYWFQENSKILIINLKEIGTTGSDTVAAQALCSRYTNYSQNELVRHDKGISFLPAHGNEYYAYIKDPQLYQGMNFALFLKGVKAVYPLATPLVMAVEPERGLAFYGELGGREIWSSNVPVYTSIAYEADMAMKLAVLDDQEQTDARFAYIERELNNVKPSNINIGALDFTTKSGVLSIVPTYGANVFANDGSRQIEFKITSKYLEIVFGQFYRYDDGGIYTIAISKTGKYRLTKTGNFTVI